MEVTHGMTVCVLVYMCDHINIRVFCVKKAFKELVGIDEVADDNRGEDV